MFLIFFLNFFGGVAQIERYLCNVSVNMAGFLLQVRETNET